MPTPKYLKRIERTPTASAIETRNFLSNHSITDDALMRELWNLSSGLPGLLDARKQDSAVIRRKGEKDFWFDTKANVYRHGASNRAVSEREIRSAIAKTAVEAQNRMREETKKMLAGTILFVIWYNKMRSILKALFRAVWVVSLGGLLFENDMERNLFYVWVVLYFQQFDELKIAIESGTMPFNGHILSAVGRFARKANGMWQNLKLQKGKLLGHKEARRILGENENHCNDSDDKPGCIELAKLDWIPIAQLVPIGDATCRDNCKCRIETRK